MLVSAMYNIVDQIFIGQGVGMLGNAATNVAFPVTTVATALALLLGIGGASNYNLEMGAGQEKKASGIAGIQWFFRQQTFQPGKRLFEGTRKNRNYLVESLQ